jgi:hypothetical protein
VFAGSVSVAWYWTWPPIVALWGVAVLAIAGPFTVAVSVALAV